jgi:hypothetical protein
MLAQLVKTSVLNAFTIHTVLPTNQLATLAATLALPVPLIATVMPVTSAIPLAPAQLKLFTSEKTNPPPSVWPLDSCPSWPPCLPSFINFIFANF